MKRKYIPVLLIIVLFAISGCASNKTKPEEMFFAPDFPKTKKDIITNIDFRLPEKLDVADTAFLGESGIKIPSFSWKTVEWKKEKNGKWKVVGEWYALRLEIPNEEPLLVITFPDDGRDHFGNLISVRDHAGLRLYNQQGQYIHVPEGWRKVNPDDYPNFFTKISDKNTVKLTKGSLEYDDCMNFYDKFITEALESRDKVYSKYDVPIGTPFSKELLDRVKNDPEVEKLKSFFFDNWYVFFTYPLLSPVDYGAFIFISKAWQIPTTFWKDDTDRPGYMDRRLTASGAYNMMEYYSRKYGGFGSGSGGVEKLLSPELKQTIKEVHGKDFTTYGEYNAWVIKQNNQ
ncbi:hypothetical protein DRH27_00590 [Candidatus Falkowbacteria bacterium]|nr:MAG: hypothetical protein DRH27_00590 [Candidatus Falkowbacteria bacterium]